MRLRTIIKASKFRLICCWLFLFLIQVQVNISNAADQRIAVIYPLVQKPYSTVFEQIIDGIASESKTELAKYGLGGENEKQDGSIQEWLSDQQSDVVVALGRRGIKGVQNANLTIPFVFGGVLYVTDSTSKVAAGISLTPDPAQLFGQLKRLSPRTKQIFVVYNPSRYQWLVDLAKPAAMSLGVTLTAIAADGLRDSAKIHRDLLRKADGKTDSVWLLQDPGIVGSSTILPMILKEAWNKKLIVFSSNPSDVPRGALFSFFADHKALGRGLARLALKQQGLDQKDSKSISPLPDARSAVNIRTASHIGLHIPYEEQRKFDLVFPRK